MLKATFSGASSVLQVPAGIVGARYGEMLVLLLGNLWVGLGLVGMALTGTFLLLLGAAFLILVDIPGRALMSGAEIPIGVVTAMLGGPFFILLLRTRRAGV